MPGSVKVGGAWKSVAEASVRVDGSWKSVSSGWTRVGGAWKQWLGWAAGTLENEAFWRSAGYAPLSNAKWFAYGGLTTTGANNKYAYSNTSDASSWTTGTLPVSTALRGTATNGSRLLWLSITAGGILYTDNGTTWTVTSPFTTNLAPLEAVYSATDGLFVVAAQSGTTGAQRIAYSSDAVSWTRNTNLTSGFLSMAHGGGRYVLVRAGASSSSVATFTHPSQAETSVSLPLTQGWTAVRHNGSVFLIVGDNLTSYATSPDGLTWTLRSFASATAPTGEGAAGRVNLGVLNGVFYYVDFNSSTQTAVVYSSSNAVTWASVATVSAQAQGLGWATNGQTAIFVGYARNSSGTQVANSVLLKGP